ncbi:hypothetical protein CCMA1212_003181 [Trichoderma ghanense]|uniref:HFB protein n=1 Tax=Trichoderma ghanense TaxID=65468 RepID=A0ABY2HAS9_9HYPO
MKTSAVIVAVAAALVSAQAPPEGTNKVSCAKPNAAYCMGGDIIVRCDGNSIGTAGRCSDNVAGYPPQGGVAECWQSSELAGDAACQKNCVVYAQPSFTLAASECTPSFTASATAAPTTLESSVVVTTTVVYSTPNGTVPTITSTAAPAPPVQTTPVGTGVPPPPPVGGNGTAPSGTNTPVGPTTTGGSTGPSTVPTNAAVANHATGALAVMGLVAACFL